MSCVFDHCAVCCDSTIAAEAGREILQKGGSAIDAAIATLLVNGLCNSHSMGIGGGFFMVYFNNTEKTAYGIDAREVAPLESRSMNADDDIDHGSFTIATPTELLGYKAIHDRWGKLPWKELFAAAIRYASGGFPVSHALSRAIRIFRRHQSDGLKPVSLFQNMLTNSATGVGYTEGELMQRPLLAKTFETVAKEGIEQLLPDLLADLKEIGCSMTEDDFRNYQIHIHRPLLLDLQNCPGCEDLLSILTCAPPSGGCIVLLIMNLLASLYGSGGNDSSGNNSFVTDDTLFYHRLVECVKMSYPAFEYVGDATFHPEVNDFLKKILDPQLFNEGIKRIVHDDAAQTVAELFRKVVQVIDSIEMANPNDASLLVNQGGTAHVSVVSPSGDVVSVTSSINNYFGSCIIGRRTGILFNNTMLDFAYPERERFRLAISGSGTFRHMIAPGKRPVSAMSPIIVLRRRRGSARDSCDNNALGLRFEPTTEVYMSCGGAGGSRIAGSVAFVLAQSLFLFNKSVPRPLSASIAAPRIRHSIHHSSAELGTIIVEDGFRAEIKHGLERIGHRFESETERYTTVVSGIQAQLLQNNNKSWLACSDGRKGGAPAGF